MKKSEQIAELAAALGVAQSKFPDIPKNKQVSAGNYTFKYADLASIIASVRGPLAENGLAFSQSVSIGEGGSLLVDTMLMHKSGQWIETTTPIKVEKSGNQGFGSAQTYGKRYALCAALGIVADDDDDGNLGDGKHEDIKRIETVAPKNPPGITAAKVAINQTVREINACEDEDSLVAFLATKDMQDLARKVCKDYPSEWTGPEQFSGLRGMIEKAGRTLGCEARTMAYIVGVEKIKQKATQ